MAPLPSPKVRSWIAERQLGKELYLTAITVAEILYGIELLPQGKRRDRLHLEAEATFAEDFAGRVLPFDEVAANTFAQIAASRRSKGRPIADFDAQIAAIAQCNGAVLATRNISDFEGCGVQLINPWVD
jgi:predicted nucleic acid-binding protein